MPKINVYLPEELAAAVREAQVPVSAVCQHALERAVRDVTSLRATDEAPEEEQPGVGTFKRFTARARRAVTLAEAAARGVPHNYLGTEHLLLGLIDEGDNLAIKALKALSIEVPDLRAELVASLGPPTTPPRRRVPFTPLAKEALVATISESVGMAHNFIGCEHLLLGLIATEEGLASEVLRRMGVERLTTRRAVVSALAGYLHALQVAPAAQPDTAATLQDIVRRLDTIERRLPS